MARAVAGTREVVEVACVRCGVPVTLEASVARAMDEDALPVECGGCLR